MTRFVLFLLLVAALAFLAVWVADNPGRVTLTWDEYRIESSVAVLVGAGALLSAFAIVLYRLFRLFWYGPRSLARERAQRRERRGYLALTQGLVAAAAGDAKGARRLARRANALLGEPPLTLLLSAQAAQLEGDEAGASAYFEAMLGRPETEFLGLRGLLVEAAKTGRQDKALALAKRAYALKPDALWVLTTLIDLEAKAGQWMDAEATLKEAARRRALGHGEARRVRAVLLFGRARALGERGLNEEALVLAKEALGERPGFVPAALLAAQLLIGRERADAARRVLEAAWRAGPHPALGELFLESLGSEPAMARFEAVQKLVGEEPAEAEGRLLLARAMMEAGLFGLARSQLAAAGKARNTARVHRLMAELEEREKGDREAAARHLARAASAPPDPQWLCERCTAPSPEWLMHCYNCGAFDRMVWRAPPPISRLAAAAGAAKAPAKPAPAQGAAGAEAAGAQTRPRSRLAAWLSARTGGVADSRTEKED